MRVGEARQREALGPAHRHLPFCVPSIEVQEVSGLDAPSAGESAAGGAAQRAPLHGHVQPLCVVHGLQHDAARSGVGRVRVVWTQRRPSRGQRARGRSSPVRAERGESCRGRHAKLLLTAKL